jgi:hypothetical protein
MVVADYENPILVALRLSCCRARPHGYVRPVLESILRVEAAIRRMVALLPQETLVQLSEGMASAGGSLEYAQRDRSSGLFAASRDALAARLISRFGSPSC